MLPISTIEKMTVSVFNPTSACLFLPIIEPASASSRPIGAKRPANMTAAVERLKKTVFAEEPKKSEPLLAAADVNSYRT
jgi:hypothetical protein